MSARCWWQQPRSVSVVVDNDSWITPYAERLVKDCSASGDHARFCHSYDQLISGDIAFYLGCIHIAPRKILRLNHRNLVVHESALPQGRGFAPLIWQILEDRNEIHICLIEAAIEADTGPIYGSGKLVFTGTELGPELRAAQGEATIDLCMKYLASEKEPAAVDQEGAPSYYRRRTPADSELSTGRTLAEQFNLLRVADNDKYPAFFRHRGQKYLLYIKRENDD